MNLVKLSRNSALLALSLVISAGAVLPSFVSAATFVVTEADVATTPEGVVAEPTKWFFYNDTNDTIMTLDQFSGTGGENHMESVASEGGAKMMLDTGTNPRYNIATAQFSSLLSGISALTFRVYDATADSDTPYLHFNVDFATSTISGYQSRLAMVPGAGGNAALSAATWTTVNALDTGAMW